MAHGPASGGVGIGNRLGEEFAVDDRRESRAFFWRLQDCCGGQRAEIRKGWRPARPTHSPSFFLTRFQASVGKRVLKAPPLSPMAF